MNFFSYSKTLLFKLQQKIANSVLFPDGIFQQVKALHDIYFAAYRLAIIKNRRVRFGE